MNRDVTRGLDEGSSLEFIFVCSDLVFERIVSSARTSIDDVLHKDADKIVLLFERQNEVVFNSVLLVRRQALQIKVGNLVQICDFAQGTEKVISTHGSLTLEECEPEDLSVLSLQMLAHLLAQVVVHNVLEIDLIEIVGPGVEDGEAFVFNFLFAVLKNIIAQKFKICLVRQDGV